MVRMSRKVWISMLGSAALACALGGSAWAQEMPAHASSAGMHAMGSMHSGMQGSSATGMQPMRAMHSGAQGMHTQNMQKDKMGMRVMGMHMMPVTVTAVDATTGIVDVTANGMALKVHFPPKAMADLKAGDKITLRMGFSKP